MIEYKIQDNKIYIQQYRILVYIYTGDDFENDSYSELVLFARDDEDLEALKTVYLNKHRRYIIHEIEDLEIDNYKWINGLTLPDGISDISKFVNDIAEMGKEAYEESLVTTTEDYLLELDYQLNMIKLGLND